MLIVQTTATHVVPNSELWAATSVHEGCVAVACSRGGQALPKLALAALERRRPELLALGASGAIAEIHEVLHQAFQEASESVHGAAQGLVSMTAAVTTGGTLHLAHVGRTHARLQRGDASVTLTLDHSLAADMVRKGSLRADEATQSPLQHLLLQAVGRFPAVDVDVLQVELEPGDLVVLGTPTLTGHQATWAALRGSGDLLSATDALVAGGQDTAAAVVLYAPAPTDPVSRPARMDEVLSTSPLFVHFDHGALLRLAAYLDESYLPAGEALCREGDAADTLVLIADGELQVSRGGVALTVLSTGDHLGEIGLVCGGRRTATVRATRTTRLISLHKERLNLLLQRRPDLAALFMQALVESLAPRVKDLTERLAAQS